MKTPRTIWLRIRSLWHRREAKREIDEELRFHLEQQTAENIATGMSPEDAAREARKRFGNFQNFREDCRDTKGVSFGETLCQDIRFGWRVMTRHPGSTTFAVLILALGIGGATAVFSVADKVILNPIPGLKGGRLIALHEVDVMHNARCEISPPLFHAVSNVTNIFRSLETYFQSPEDFHLELAGVQSRVTGVRTSPGFFRLLGVRLLAGRSFLPQEGSDGYDNVLVASYGFWQQDFAGAPGFVGSSINLDGRAYTVIGIAPPAFQFPFGPGENQFWIPHVFSPEELANPDRLVDRTWSVIGRLRLGVSLEQAGAAVNAVEQRILKEHPDHRHKWVVKTEPARMMFVGPTLARTLWSLQVAVLMVLLISCANVGTLLLSRAAARRSEFSIRIAVGASRFRVARQLLTESLLLGGLAGLLGLIFAWGGIRALNYLYLGNLPHLRGVGLDWSVFSLTFAASGFCGLLFGVAPAWLVGRLRPNDSLKGTTHHSVSLTQRLFQDGMAVLQLALTVVLLVGAGLMVQTTVRLLQVNPNLDPHGLYVVWYEPLHQITHPDLAAAAKHGLSRKEALAEWWPQEVQLHRQWNERVVERLSATPGIISAAINGASSGSYPKQDYHVEGTTEPVRLCMSDIGVNYFRTLRLPLVRGRLLAKEDCVPGQTAVVINQELAKRCWPGESPLGKHIFPTDKDEMAEYPVLRVVGVVKDMRDWHMDLPQGPTFYYPVERNNKSILTSGKFVLRSSLDPNDLRKLVVKIGKEMSPSVELDDFHSVETQLYQSTAPRRTYMWLLIGMGALGLLMSALGLYAIISYAVVQRTREIGVRMALGATKSSIARLVLGRVGRLLLNGMGLGLVIAFTLAHYLKALLYGVTAGDPWTYFYAFLLLGLVAILASFVPARNAMDTNPMTALRHE